MRNPVDAKIAYEHFKESFMNTAGLNSLNLSENMKIMQMVMEDVYEESGGNDGFHEYWIRG